MLLRDGSIRNAYTLKLRNMESRPRAMEIALEGLPGALLWTDAIARSDAAPSQQVEVPADAIGTVRAYVLMPPGSANQSFSFRLTSLDEQRETHVQETALDRKSAWWGKGVAVRV